MMRTCAVLLLVIGFVAGTDHKSASPIRTGGSTPRNPTAPPTGRPASGSSTPRTSSRQSTTQGWLTFCYSCGGFGSACPFPFDRKNVATVPSTTGWCQKMSPVSGATNVFTRGVAQSNRCTRGGCTREYVNGVLTEVCCCDRSYCNAGIASTKSAVTLLGSALAMLLFRHMI